MNAHTLEVARELKADPSWEWIPGMRGVPLKGDGFARRLEVLDAVSIVDPWHAFNLLANTDDLVPDLDDALTRLGLLVHVRNILADPGIGIVDFGLGEEWADTRWVVVYGGSQDEIASGPTEAEALANAALHHGRGADD